MNVQAIRLVLTAAGELRATRRAKTAPCWSTGIADHLVFGRRADNGKSVSYKWQHF